MLTNCWENSPTYTVIETIPNLEEGKVGGLVSEGQKYLKDNEIHWNTRSPVRNGFRDT